MPEYVPPSPLTMSKPDYVPPSPLSGKYSGSFAFPTALVPPVLHRDEISTDDNQRNRSRKRVWFGKIEIHEHRYILGDNPSVSDGAPVSIAWRSQHEETYDVEYYEIYNPSESRRGARSGLKLSADDRHRLLLISGHSMTEIVARSLDTMKAKKAREDSVRNRKWDGIHQKIENTTRSLKKVARRGSTLVRLGSSRSENLDYRDTLLSPPQGSPRRKIRPDSWLNTLTLEPEESSTKKRAPRRVSMDTHKPSEGEAKPRPPLMKRGSSLRIKPDIAWFRD